SLVVPLTSLLMPQYSLGVLPSALDASSSATADLDPSPTGGAPSSQAGASGPDFTGINLTADVDARPHAPPPVESPTVQSSTAGQPVRPGMEQLFVFCWLVGAMIGLAVFIVSFFRQSIRLRGLRRIDDVSWLDSVAGAARVLGIKRPIVTLESDDTCVPAVVGVFFPRLIVPCDWRTWSRTQRHCILLHELAHIKRRDVSTQLLGRLAALTYWFNPFVWHAIRRLRVERELASDDCVLLAGQTASDYAEQLLWTLRRYRPAQVAMGVAMAHTARLDQRVLAILDPQRRRNPVGSRIAVILSCIVGAFCGVLGGVTLTSQVAVADPPVELAATKIATDVWQENYTVELPGSLPVSVAFSADGKTLLTGDTNGEIMALVFRDDELRWRWKSNVAGSHAAVAFAADQKQIYATTEHGVRILDTKGKEQALIEEKDSNPTSIGVFPDKTIAADFTRAQIVFGNTRGYFIKSWAKGEVADTIGTIKTSTVAQGGQPADTAVPLAVDPKGRSAIMTGPIDGTGAVSGAKGKNVLWAYVCGDHGEGSPGNRVMVGHSATAVSAAWAKSGGVAVTGDAAGRVITWDAKTMKETGRLELGGRVAALAISNDAARTAAYVLGKRGEVFVWETAKPQKRKPIHTDLSDFAGSSTYASLTFSPSGKQLAGCAIDKRWLNRLGELVGKVRVWEIADAPKDQRPPRRQYTKALPNKKAPSFVILNNHSILMAAD
ncbi:MAG: M56 family metallopeptidase, partial [Pirellulaceae bacterium]|nr:M56 family metallopeptidase [Pirellulaceae bacterium]